MEVHEKHLQRLISRNVLTALSEHEDDHISVDTKSKEATVHKTNDDFDLVSVDGADPVKVAK